VKLYKETPATSSKDYSGIGILVSNLLAIALAVIEGWSLGSMMVIYWVQSVVIGIFHVFRMLLLRSFCTEGFTSNGTRVPENAKGKISTAIFFAIHYGFFHLIYGIFLIVGAASGIGEGENARSRTRAAGGMVRRSGLVRDLDPRIRRGARLLVLSECEGRSRKPSESRGDDVHALRPHPPDAPDDPPWRYGRGNVRIDADLFRIEDRGRLPDAHRRAPRPAKEET
jgi:hypothetical protein